MKGTGEMDDNERVKLQGHIRWLERALTNAKYDVVKARFAIECADALGRMRATDAGNEQMDNTDEGETMRKLRAENSELEKSWSDMNDERYAEKRRCEAMTLRTKAAYGHMEKALAAIKCDARCCQTKTTSTYTP